MVAECLLAVSAELGDGAKAGFVVVVICFRVISTNRAFMYMLKETVQVQTNLDTSIVSLLTKLINM